jgi:hypothetical protein
MLITQYSSTETYRTPSTALFCLEIRCLALAPRRISRNQEITLDHLVGNEKLGAFEEDEELDPGTKERAMRGFKFTNDLGLAEVASTCLGRVIRTNSEQEQLNYDDACYKYILHNNNNNNNNRCFLAGVHCLTFSNYLQGLVHLHLYCWTLKMIIHMVRLQF